MPNHTQTAKADFGDLLQALKKAAAGWAENARNMKAVDALTQKVVSSSGNLKKALAGTSDANKQLIRDMSDQEKYMKKIIATSQKLRAEQRKAATERKRQSKLSSRQSRINKNAVGMAGQFSTTDVDLAQQYNVALQQATAEAKKHGLTLTQWKQQLDQVKTKGVDPYVNKYNSLQRSLLKVIGLERQLGSARQASAASGKFATQVSPLFSSLPKDSAMFRELSSSLAGVQSQIVSAGKSSTQIRDVWTRLISGKQIPRWAAGMSRGMTQILKISDQIGYRWTVNKNTQEATLQKLSPLERLHKMIADNSQHTMFSWRNILRIVGSHIMYSGIARIVGGLTSSVGAAITLQRKIAEVQTIDTSNTGIDVWIAQLSELSDSFGIPVMDQAEAAYQALSNQIVTGASATNFLTEANKFAVTAVTDASTAVNLATAKLNAYGESNIQAAQTFAEFFKVIELGRVRASEMAGTYGRVGIAAAQLGVAHADLGAAISTLSIQGVNYNETATQLRGIMIALLKPTKEMKRFFVSLGVATGEAAIAAYGFGGVIERMGEYTKGSSTEMAKLIPRIRGISGAFAFSGKGMKVYERNLEQIRNATDTYADRTQVVMTNTGKFLEIEMNKVKTYLQAGFGQAAVKNIAAFTRAIGGVENAIKAMNVAIKSTMYLGLGIAFLKIQTGVTSLLTGLAGTAGLGAAIKALTLSFAPLTAAVFAARSAMKAFHIYITGNADVVNNIANDWTEAWNNMAEASVESVNTMLAEMERAITTLSNMVAKKRSGAIRLFGEEAEKGVVALEKALKGLKEEHGLALKQMGREVKAWERGLSSAESAISALNSRIRTIETGSSAKLFDWGLEDQPLDKQINIVTTKIKSIQRQTGLLLRKNQLTKDDIANFNFLRSEMERYFDLRRSLHRRAIEEEKANEEKIQRIREKRQKVEYDFRKSMRDLEWERLKLGSNADPEALFDLQRRENSLVIERKRKLKDLRSEEREIVRIHVRKIDHAREYNRLLKEELGILKKQSQTRQQDANKVKAEDGRLKKRVDYEKLVANLGQVVKFDIGDIYDANDLRALDTTIDEITKKIKETQLLYKEVTGRQDYRPLTELDRRLEVAEKNRRTALTEQKREEERRDAQVTGTANLTELGKISEELSGRLGQLVKVTNQTMAQYAAGRRGPYGQAMASTILTPADFLSGSMVPGRQYAEGKNRLKEMAGVWESLISALSSDPGSDRAKTLTRELHALTNLMLQDIPSRGLKDEALAFRNNLVAISRATKGTNEDGLLPLAKALQRTKFQIRSLRDDIPTLERALCKNLSSELEFLRDRANEAATAVRIAATTLGAQAQGKATGGIIGMDTIPTMLSPGEFVVNSRAAKENFSQLMSINNGLANGGSSNSINVGDVHVNLTSSGNEQYDAVALGKAIRTEIRRGNVRW